MIAARGLSRDFDGRAAVRDLTFAVPAGSLCALLGPNGAGKTTTLRLLLGLIPPSAGSAEVAGVELPAADGPGARLRRSVGLLTEAPGFYDRLSGRENLEIFGRLYGLPGPLLAERIERWLRRLELWEARDKPFGAWSKGMKQRLALIRAVLHEPEVIFLDEPTSGLDPAGAREVRDLIGTLRREGRTILLCTHNLTEAQELADLVGILRTRMLAFGPPATLTAERPRLVVRLGRNVEPLDDLVRSLPGVLGCEAAGDTLRLVLADPERDTPAVIRELVRGGAPVLEVTTIAPSLEEIYLRAVAEEPA